MIHKTRYIISKQTNPYENLALEEYLLHQVTEGECILYLWQNEKTVVIGRNQNPWKECKSTELEAEGGIMVRRLSGGGAVFHDLGNLNFTFLVKKEDYNVEKQLEVIIQAVNHRGIPAIISGRNDITVEGKKISGNAYYSEGEQCYHHGTILVHVDMTMLSRYLNVSKEKLISKGVDSVRARVSNLSGFQPEIEIESMKQGIIEAFGEVYGFNPKEITLEEIDRDRIQEGKAKFSSWEWNYGKPLQFTHSIEKRFPWGGVEFYFKVEDGVIQECVAYSDALEIILFETFAQYVAGLPYRGEELIRAIGYLPDGMIREQMRDDLIEFIRDEI